MSEPPYDPLYTKAYLQPGIFSLRVCLYPSVAAVLARQCLLHSSLEENVYSSGLMTRLKD